MKKKYIIDGFNLGFKIPSIAEWITKGETDKAIRLILNFIHTRLFSKGNQVIVVFDGKHGGHGHIQSHQGIQIKFSKKPETADDIIRNFIRNASDTRLWTVVSSDSEIIYTAQDQGAQAVKSEIFINQLKSPSVKKTNDNMQKYNPGDVDVEYWLKQFGADKDE
jgi:predicted RNA-binding protein with PIN domain